VSRQSVTARRKRRPEKTEDGVCLCFVWFLLFHNKAHFHHKAVLANHLLLQHLISIYNCLLLLRALLIPVGQNIMSRSALWRQEGNVKERERQAEELFQLAVEEGRVRTV
jgi:hypothetical protein